jgi:hypothetical protein
MRVMVWASFWGTGERFKLILLTRDFESKSHRYTANSYIEALEARVLEHYYDGLIFMQDNAPIHTAHKVRGWFKESRIKTTDRPTIPPTLTPLNMLSIPPKF